MILFNMFQADETQKLKLNFKKVKMQLNKVDNQIYRGVPNFVNFFEKQKKNIFNLCLMRKSFLNYGFLNYLSIKGILVQYL